MAATDPQRTKPIRSTGVSAHPPVDALVAVVKSKADFRHADRDGWYRIPRDKAPRDVLEGRIQHLAFYLPKQFGDEAWQVHWGARVTGLRESTRRELLPAEDRHPRADAVYLKLELDPLGQLARPILSRRLRRIVFIPTTWQKLQTAREINDLFHASPWEDVLWDRLKAEDIAAEREYFVPGDRSSKYALDFAVFGQNRNLDIECDGDTYHISRQNARYDNARNNFLTARGWSVLRFSTDMLREDMPHVVREVQTAIQNCGGLVPPEPSTRPTPDLLWQSPLWGPSLASGRAVNPSQRARRTPARRRS
jgi:very-short-patch-repair endonuclease